MEEIVVVKDNRKQNGGEETSWEKNGGIKSGENGESWVEGEQRDGKWKMRD